MSKYYLNNCSIIDFCFFNVLIKFYTKKSFKNQKNKIITNKSILNLISTEKSVFLVHLEIK